MRGLFLKNQQSQFRINFSLRDDNLSLCSFHYNSYQGESSDAYQFKQQSLDLRDGYEILMERIIDFLSLEEHSYRYADCLCTNQHWMSSRLDRQAFQDKLLSQKFFNFGIHMMDRKDQTYYLVQFSNFYLQHYFNLS